MRWISAKERRRLKEIERHYQVLCEATFSLLTLTQEISLMAHVVAPVWGDELSGLLERFRQCDDNVVRTWVQEAHGETAKWKREDNVVWLRHRAAPPPDTDLPDLEALRRFAFFANSVAKDVGIALPIWRQRVGMICDRLRGVENRDLRELARLIVVSMPGYCLSRPPAGGDDHRIPRRNLAKTNQDRGGGNGQ